MICSPSCNGGLDQLDDQYLQDLVEADAVHNAGGSGGSSFNLIVLLECFYLLAVPGTNVVVLAHQVSHASLVSKPVPGNLHDDDHMDADAHVSSEEFPTPSCPSL